MIPLESQVSSLALSQRLKELGVKQESLFEYRLFSNGEENFWSLPVLVGTIPKKLGAADVGMGECSAFTVAELGAMLPKNVCTNGHGMCMVDPDVEGVTGEQVLVSTEKAGVPNTEANGRALILIHLIEQKLITL